MISSFIVLWNASLTASRVQSPSTSFAFEVLGLLMVDEDLLIIEISLTVIAPWPFYYLVERRVLALVFTHHFNSQAVLPTASSRVSVGR